MNDEQYKRFRKMNAESDAGTLKCLISKKDKVGSIHFLINGSTGTHYKVSIYKNGKITCGCPDYTHGFKDNECVCKHCLYVLYRELRLFKDLEPRFFNRLFFTPDEIQTIKQLYSARKAKHTRGI